MVFKKVIDFSFLINILKGYRNWNIFFGISKTAERWRKIFLEIAYFCMCQLIKLAN